MARMDPKPMRDFTMWAAFKSGGQASNPEALKELIDQWIQMTMQKTAGQRPNNKKDISWDNLERVLMGILGEAVALSLSGDLDEIIRRRKSKTQEVTEMCPHCEREITMQWNLEDDGYKAYCPVCGKRLMLCDMCQHSGPDGTYSGGCNYDSSTDSCEYNPEHRRLWMCLGVALLLNDEDEKLIFGDDEAAAIQAAQRVINEGRYEVDGDSYIPAESFEIFNANYGTDYPAAEMDL